MAPSYGAWQQEALPSCSEKRPALGRSCLLESLRARTQPPRPPFTPPSRVLESGEERETATRVGRLRDWNVDWAGPYFPEVFWSTSRSGKIAPLFRYLQLAPL
jgi:hypothetical protein